MGDFSYCWCCIGKGLSLLIVSLCSLFAKKESTFYTGECLFNLGHSFWHGKCTPRCYRQIFYRGSIWRLSPSSFRLGHSSRNAVKTWVSGVLECMSECQTRGGEPSLLMWRFMGVLSWPLAVSTALPTLTIFGVTIDGLCCHPAFVWNNSNLRLVTF